MLGSTVALGQASVSTGPSYASCEEAKGADRIGSYPLAYAAYFHQRYPRGNPALGDNTFEMPETPCADDRYTILGVTHPGFRTAQELLKFIDVLFAKKDVRGRNISQSDPELVDQRLEALRISGGITAEQIEMLLARIAVRPEMDIYDKTKMRGVSIFVDGVARSSIYTGRYTDGTSAGPAFMNDSRTF